MRSRRAASVNAQVKAVVTMTQAVFQKWFTAIEWHHLPVGSQVRLTYWVSRWLILREMAANQAIEQTSDGLNCCFFVNCVAKTRRTLGKIHLCR